MKIKIDTGQGVKPATYQARGTATLGELRQMLETDIKLNFQPTDRLRKGSPTTKVSRLQNLYNSSHSNGTRLLPYTVIVIFK